MQSINSVFRFVTPDGGGRRCVGLDQHAPNQRQRFVPVFHLKFNVAAGNDLAAIHLAKCRAAANRVAMQPRRRKCVFKRLLKPFSAIQRQDRARQVDNQENHGHGLPYFFSSNGASNCSKISNSSSSGSCQSQLRSSQKPFNTRLRNTPLRGAMGRYLPWRSSRSSVTFFSSSSTIQYSGILKRSYCSHFFS